MARGKTRLVRQRGVSLIQALIAVPMLLLTILGAAAVLASASRQRASAEATGIAISVLRDKVNEIQAYANQSLGDTYTHYTSSAHNTFTVPAISGVRAGLTPLPGNTHVGRIYCWNDETGAALPSGANPGDSTRVGLPRDLNMDDDAEDANLLSFDMKVIPMKITLDFVDASGSRHIEVFYMVASQPQ